jgi:signal transduction histidine kinase/ligand-binding sensor domain-containing protein
MSPFSNALRLSRRSIFKNTLCRAAVFCLIFRVGAVQCQGPGRKDQSFAEQLNGGVAQQSWTIDDGLPQNSVHAILQTHDGFLWIATEDGLARFDGLNFRVFQQASEPALISGDICCLAEDSRNALWIGTADGLVRESGGRFERYGVKEGLPSSTIQDLAVAIDGSVLAQTTMGLVRVDSQGRVVVLRIPGGDTVLAMSRSADGTVWLVTSNDLLRYEGGELHQQTTLSTHPLTGVVDLAVVPGQQAVWLRSAREVTLMRGAEQRTWTVGRELPGKRTESISADSRGVVWIGTNRGLVSIDATSAAISRLVPRVVPMISGSVLSTTEDREGDRWVGTESAGLSVLRRQPFRTIPAIADEAITAVTQTSDGVIWMATREDGLWRADSGTVERAAVSPKLASRVVLALAPGLHGDLWVGTVDGLNRVNGMSVDTYTSANGLPDDFIRSLLVDPGGTVWVGTRRGLVHLDGSSGKILATYTRREGLGSDSIGALLRPVAARSGEGSSATKAEDDLWIATFDGLSRLRDGSIKNFTKSDGLSGNVVTSLAQDDSRSLWIGTRGDGLSRYSHGAFTSFREEGLPNDIDSILPDSQGRLWMGTRHGVAQASMAMMEGCGADAHCIVGVSRYGYPDGLPSEDLSASGHPAASRMRDGSLWFATPRGVAIVDPSLVERASAAPPVAIERLLADDVEMSLTDGDAKIPPGKTRVSVEYAGLSFRAPSRIRFRYMLEGFDREWTDAGPRRTAYYTNLPPGSYRFLVQAMSGDGLWNGTSAAIRFAVEPPYYRRWWFYLLVIVATSGSILLLYRLRLRRLQREFNAVLTERTRIAREIHDTLAQDFVGVSLQLEVVAQTLARNDLPAARSEIDAARKLVREGLADARQSIWELRAVSAKDSLPTRLGRVMQRASDRGLKAECRVGGTYRALPQKLEDEILRIAQEAVTNTVRHARATTVSADLQYSPRRLLLRIVDDGRGFDVGAASSNGGHFGLTGMQERAAMIAGRLKVESLTGKGTSVTMDVDI